MGLRSNYPRREGDRYWTPFEAVPPLIPHLGTIRTFAEPCCGDGDLVRHLETFHLRCVYSGDIAQGRDALATTDYGKPDAIISNIPYERTLMHRLIAHFVAAVPVVWLLLEYRWSVTKQALPYLDYCTLIVPVRRLKLIADSRDVGKEDFAWFRFEAGHSGGPLLAIDENRKTAVTRCAACDRPYRSTRRDAVYCSNRCRQKAYRDRPVTIRNAGTVS